MKANLQLAVEKRNCKLHKEFTNFLWIEILVINLLSIKSRLYLHM